MNFTELVTELKKSSGKSSLTDARAAYFLNAGMRYLEGQQPMGDAQVFDEVSLAEDGYTITISHNTASGQSGALRIKRVWRQGADDSEWKLLDYSPLDALITKYPKLGSSDTGTPIYWSYNSYDKDSANVNATTTQIILMPPASATTTMRMDYEIGMSDFLSTDTTKTNIWATSFPWILIKSAMLQLEQHYGNTTRSQALMLGIDADLDSIDKKLVGRELAIGTIMERSIIAGQGNAQVIYVYRRGWEEA